MWLTSRHLKGGTAEIRFVMGSGRVWRIYNCKMQKKKKMYVRSEKSKKVLINTSFKILAPS